MTSLPQLLKHADENRYAIPAFNYSDIWDFLAIVKTAEEERANVILASNPLVVGMIGLELCAAIGKAAAAKSDVVLIHHLDHSSEPKLCCSAIDLGYPSVMIDASKCTLEENIRRTKAVADYGHLRNVCVEGEIGRIRGKGIEGDFTGEEYLTNPEEAAVFAEQTGVDSLAVGIGTAHGFYVGKPEINFGRLDEINRRVKVPLVLHGGTGIPAENIGEAIRCGINKVNVGTLIHSTYMNGMKRELESRPENPYTLDVVKPVIAEIQEAVRSWIRICKADHRAE